MALTERSVIDQIMVLEDGRLQVRRADMVLRDGVEISKTYHRHIVIPGAALEGEDVRVQAVAGTVHTPDVITAYEGQLS